MVTVYALATVYHDIRARRFVVIWRLKHGVVLGRRRDDANVRKHERDYANVTDLAVSVVAIGGIMKSISRVFHFERGGIVIDAERRRIGVIRITFECIVDPARARHVAVQDPNVGAVAAALAQLYVIGFDVNPDYNPILRRGV